MRPPTDTHTHTQSHVTTIHFASSTTHAKCNERCCRDVAMEIIVNIGVISEKNKQTHPSMLLWDMPTEKSPVFNICVRSVVCDQRTQESLFFRLKNA